MGMKAWRDPQSSEHIPRQSPGCWIRTPTWFNRPGVPSSLTPNEGTAHAWITSAPVTIRRICASVGTTIRRSTSRRRSWPSRSWSVFTM